MSFTKQELDKQKRINFLRDNEEEVRTALAEGADPEKVQDLARKAMGLGLFAASTTEETAIAKLKNVAKRHIGWTI